MRLVPVGATGVNAASLMEPRLPMACATPANTRGRNTAPITPMAVNSPQPQLRHRPAARRAWFAGAEAQALAQVVKHADRGQ